ncbi:MAG TPA: chemotaxis-specific protein-glutamate methyltransferase CheB [Myxococcales bacterium]|nr:chemotaxis-specific protein-glutamate methyltransferase CheB [Myxococcales bacterium]
MGKKVGVLVVDDSPICRQLICDALARDPDMEVVGMAADGREAVALSTKLHPNVITMDVDMPVMDGLAAVETIMAENPTPILVLTADPRHQAPELTCKALEVGALALQVKPSLDASPEAWNLAREVKLLSSVRVIRHLRGANKRRPPPPPQVSSPQQVAAFSSAPFGVVAVVASTGGPQVIHKMLSELPGDFPAPIVLVQHINASFAESLAGWLAAASKLKVRLAHDGDVLVPGEVLVAPPGKHLVIPARGKVSLVPGEPRDGHCPSGSTLLESVARVYGRRSVGMILTGMGADGAEGLAAIKAAGGKTLVQSEESCVVSGMPGAALARKVVDFIVHGDDVSHALLRLARSEPVSPAARER